MSPTCNVQLLSYNFNKQTRLNNSGTTTTTTSTGILNKIITNKKSLKLIKNNKMMSSQELFNLNNDVEMKTDLIDSKNNKSEMNMNESYKMSLNHVNSEIINRLNEGNKVNSNLNKAFDVAFKIMNGSVDNDHFNYKNTSIKQYQQSTDIDKAFDDAFKNINKLNSPPNETSVSKNEQLTNVNNDMFNEQETVETFNNATPAIICPLQNEIIKQLPKPIEENEQYCKCDNSSSSSSSGWSSDEEQGFFRRSIQQKIQYRPCTKNQQCSILRINRNRCQYCRLKKCIAVGMSRDAVRFGRVPKREKARILAAMQQSTNTKCQEKAVAAELDDDQRLLTTVVRAHLDTCDFTHEKVEPMLRRAREHPTYTACPPTLACPLNPNPQPLQGQQELLQDFSKRFSPAIRGVVEFAKRIPGFSLLSQDDQVTLLKAGVFEVLLVRLGCMFDSQTNSMICLNGEVLVREAIHNSSNARFLMDSMFDFAERLNMLNLSDAEIGLFSSIVVIAPDRPGLRNVELIEKMHGKLKNILIHVLNQNHPDQVNLCTELISKIPDLRTLNTLHSEKLLAFKMTEHQQQLAQQQQQQQHSWHVEENSKSPSGSSWSDVTMEEVKSPLGSVSSTESVCSNEVATLNEYTSTHAQNAPLLAATLAGVQCPHRNRANSGSTTDGDRLRFRKLDSPTDSGIESGTEKIEKHTSAPTSVCSSPRSSFEEKDFNHIEDMPVLKRILQAPPLDTSSLMDEAYKPHKKFRALRQKDSAEAEPLHPSLASSHSMLAKSLMEGPRMTPDQLKCTEIVHNYIMRTDSPPTSYFPRSWHSSSVIKPAPPATVTSNALLELQVAATSQPLNLSKKTPPASPRMNGVSLEA